MVLNGTDVFYYYFIIRPSTFLNFSSALFLLLTKYPLTSIYSHRLYNKRKIFLTQLSQDYFSLKFFDFIIET